MPTLEPRSVNVKFNTRSLRWQFCSYVSDHIPDALSITFLCCKNILPSFIGIEICEKVFLKPKRVILTQTESQVSHRALEGGSPTAHAVLLPP